MLKAFRMTSIMEGLSYLTILSVTVGLISREYVFQIGMTHGVLLILYILFSLMVANKANWSLKIWLPIFLASLIPFAFILVELYMQKVTANNQAIIDPA
ncbi:DUF3817 domain-containing protein [Alkalimarinus sediminis]|uniref:DUF3817 domain-containing protein n=1 Tax=Alkalimarinus sediminis TaxID=1632866 RepID=A0A9E8KNM0_9ALTE|nr:DUF3817 domain-containing protein [Alkalimarinus sediminis]UZW74498.1 DUF3817 domain-containing protein [Alkalimarinus sediminis]